MEEIYKMNKTLKTIAIVGGGLVCAAAGCVSGFVLDNPDTIVTVQERIVEVNNTVEVPVDVMVEKIVEVDNGNLDLVLDELYDNDGSVEYLIDDLDDDELDQVVDRIVMAQDFKALAVAEIKAELFDELDNTDVTLADNSTVELDDDDMERLRIDDDSDEVILSDIDYEDGDADVSVTGTFEQDDVKFDYEALVEIKDGEVDDFDIVSVTEA